MGTQAQDYFIYLFLYLKKVLSLFIYLFILFIPLFKKSFKFIYLFSERECTRRGGAEREGERISSRLRTISTEPNGAQTHK